MGTLIRWIVSPRICATIFTIHGWWMEPQTQRVDEGTRAPVDPGVCGAPGTQRPADTERWLDPNNVMVLTHKPHQQWEHFPFIQGFPGGSRLALQGYFSFWKRTVMCVCVCTYIYTHTYNTHTHRLYINIDTYAGCTYICFPGGSAVKGSTCQCRRYGFDPWLGKIPWRRKWQPRQYSCLENPINRGGWQGRGSQQIWTRLSD